MFNNHIRVVIVKIRIGSTPKKLKTQIATVPFKTKSNTDNIGTIEAIIYIDEIAEIALK